MKTRILSLALAASVLLAAVVSAQTPPNFIPRVNASNTNAGAGLNTALLGSTRLGSGVIGTNMINVGTFIFWQGGAVTNARFSILGTGTLLTIDGVPMVSFQPGGVAIASNLVIDGIYTGNGLGLTNLQVAAGDTFNFFGKSQFHSNVFVNTILSSTNAADSETVIDLRKNYRGFSTNNNTAFSAVAGIDSSGTNFQSVNVFETNTSGSTKTITMSASFQNMNAGDGNTLFVTNVGHLLVFLYPGFGTNFYFNSR